MTTENATTDQIADTTTDPMEQARQAEEAGIRHLRRHCQVNHDHDRLRFSAHKMWWLHPVDNHHLLCPPKPP